MSLSLLAKDVREINRANGWNVLQRSEWDDQYKIPAIVALIHSEASEALEAFRKNDLANFREELADIVIRVLDCAAGLDIDLDHEVSVKLEKNKGRGHRYGGKKI